jgi:hypothetical protein
VKCEAYFTGAANSTLARSRYNITLRADLKKSLKVLAVENDVRANDLLGEAIQDFLKKYENES